MGKEIIGNFISKYIVSGLISEEMVSKRTGINFDRLGMIINARVQATREEQDAIVAFFQNRDDLPYLELPDLFPEAKDWKSYQEKRAALIDEKRGVPLEEIKRQTKIQSERREARRQARDAARAEAAVEKLNKIQGEQRSPQPKVEIEE